MKPQLGVLVARSLSEVIDVVAARLPTRLALLSPLQSDSAVSKLTYSEIQETSTRVASGLMSIGVTPGSVVLSDLPNVAENLVLQIACDRLGAAMGTAKNAKAIETYRNEKIDIRACVSTSNPLNNSEHIFGDIMSSIDSPPVIVGSKESGGDVTRFENLLECDVSNFETNSNENDEAGDVPFAYFNSLNPLYSNQIVELGAAAAEKLSLDVEDRVCVSITLCHAFGIGSACTSAFVSGATVVLPAVGGIHGCGVPSIRAETTLDVLREQECTWCSIAKRENITFIIHFVSSTSQLIHSILSYIIRNITTQMLRNTYCARTQVRFYLQIST